MTQNNSTNSNSIAPTPDSMSQSIRITEQNGSVAGIPGFVIETVGSGAHRDEIDLREYVNRILRNKLLIVIATVLLMIAPVYYILTLPKVFQAEARIQVDSENDPGTNASKAVTTFDNRAYFNTQLMLLENPRLIRNVIREKGLETNKAFLDRRFIEPGSLSSRLNTKQDPAKTEKGAITESAFEEMGEVFDAERLNPIVEAIQASLDVEPILQSKLTVKDTQLISVKFSHPDPSISKLVANGISDELVSHNLKNKTDSNSAEREYLKNNIEELRSQIRQSENRILQFGRQHQLPSADSNQNTVVERLVGLNRQLLDAENERKTAEAKHKASLAPGAASALAEAGEKEISDIESKLDDLRRNRAQLLVEVTEKHPDALAIDKQIAVLENAARNKRRTAAERFRTGLNVNLRQAETRENSIRSSYDRQWQKMLNQNGAAINYRIIQQELETNRKLLDEMQRREKESEMLSAKAPNNIRVVEYALRPTEPVDQKQLAYLGLALIGSFSLGIAGALLKDYFSNPQHTVDASTNTVSLPSFVTIPQIGGNQTEDTRSFQASKPSGLFEDATANSMPFNNGDVPVINGKSLSNLEKAIRKQQTVLQLFPDARNTKTLLITSGVGAGQTRTSVNIATNLAQLGASVLIIDADFYDPKLHKLFDRSNIRGLSDLLTGQVFIESTKDLITEVSENLHFLPPGQIIHKFSERLASGRMSGLMASLEARYDYVIINSPPVLFYADSSVMATNMNGVLLVASENGDSLEELQQIRLFLERAGANIVGVVLGSAEQTTAATHRANSNLGVL